MVFAMEDAQGPHKEVILDVQGIRAQGLVVVIVIIGALEVVQPFVKVCAKHLAMDPDVMNAREHAMLVPRIVVVDVLKHVVLTVGKNVKGVAEDAKKLVLKGVTPDVKQVVKKDAL